MWLWNTHTQTRGLFFSVTNDGAKLSVKIIREAFEYIIQNAYNPIAIIKKAKEVIEYCKRGDGIGGAIRRALGVVPGVSDCLFIWSGRLYCFEFKTGIGHQSPAQIEWEKKVTSQGVPYFIVRSLEEFKQLIDVIL